MVTVPVILNCYWANPIESNRSIGEFVWFGSGARSSHRCDVENECLALLFPVPNVPSACAASNHCLEYNSFQSMSLNAPNFAMTLKMKKIWFNKNRFMATKARFDENSILLYFSFHWFIWKNKNSKWNLMFESQ